MMSRFKQARMLLVLGSILSPLATSTATAHPPAQPHRVDPLVLPATPAFISSSSLKGAFISPIRNERVSLALALAQQRMRTNRVAMTMMPFHDLEVDPQELQSMLRRDIGRRYTELVSLSWLGRAYLTLPWLFDAVFPTVFALEPYEMDVAPSYCYYRSRRDGNEEKVQVVCLKESSIITRGIPFRLALSLDDGNSAAAAESCIRAATLVGIGPDVTLTDAQHDAARLDKETKAMEMAEMKSMSQTLQTNRSAKRLVVNAIVSTIFERLTPVAADVERGTLLEAHGSEKVFVPRHDLWAKEGSAEKWLQNVAEYYFADARLQTVRFAQGEGHGTTIDTGHSSVLFDFYYDPTEPLNSEDMYKNINPEVIACCFPLDTR